MKTLFIALLLAGSCFAQSATLLPVPRARFVDANGAPLAGGLIYSYSAGTTTPLATYTDSTAGTPNANPVVLDSAGTANIWLSSSMYKIVVKTSAGVQISSTDNVSAVPPITTLTSLTIGGGLTVNGTATLNGTVTGTHAQNVGTSDSPAFNGGSYASSVTFNNGLVSNSVVRVYALQITGASPTQVINSTGDGFLHSLTVGGVAVIDNGRNATFASIAIAGTCGGCTPQSLAVGASPTFNGLTVTNLTTSSNITVGGQVNTPFVATTSLTASGSITVTNNIESRGNFVANGSVGITGSSCSSFKQGLCIAP
jgi:hypothetical protein